MTSLNLKETNFAKIPMIGLLARLPHVWERPNSFRRLRRIYGKYVLLLLIAVMSVLASVLWINRIRASAIPYESTSDPGIPTLQMLTAGATTDAEAVERVIAYYDANTEFISRALGETHPDRLKALYAMHVVHISHIYGPRSAPLSLLWYIAHENSHCGMYSRFQAQILDGMGMTWRIFAHDIAGHVWVEVNIDGHWEVFDSTVNVWINTDGYSLIAGLPRESRSLYTPMNDINRPDARSHLDLGYNMPRLRLWMPELGLSFNPPAPAHEIDVSAAVRGQGSRYTTPWYRWTDTEPTEWETFLPVRVISS